MRDSVARERTEAFILGDGALNSEGLGGTAKGH